MKLHSTLLMTLCSVTALLFIGTTPASAVIVSNNAPLSTMSTSLTTVEKAQVESAFSLRLDRQNDEMVDEKLEELRVKLALALIKYHRNEFLLSVLGHIQQLTIEAEDNRETGTDSTDNDDDENTDDDEDTDDDTSSATGDAGFTPQLNLYKSGPIMILGGEQSQAVAKWEVVAQNEDIMINTIELTASTDIEDAVTRIYLFDEDGTFIGSARPEGRTATFKSVNYELAQGGIDFFAVLDTALIGKGGTGPQKSDFTLQLRISEATGVSSNKNITPRSYTNTADRIIIAPVQLTMVEVTDEYEQYQSDTKLYNNTRTDLALLVIETAESSNTHITTATEVDTVIHTVKIRVVDQTEAGNVATSLQLERLDSDADPIEGTLDDGYVVFDLSDFDNEGDRIQNGETAVFAVRGMAVLDNNQDDEFVEVELADLDEGAITYSSDSTGAQTFSTVHLQTTSTSITVEE